jgi:hypothetical protein
MAFAWASLAQGQLPNAKATLYTSVGQSAIMGIKLVATDTAAHTVNIYLKKSGGSSRRLIPKDLPMDGDDPDKAAEVEVVNERPIEMSAGDVLEGDCDTAAVIDYNITGGTR